MWNVIKCDVCGCFGRVNHGSWFGHCPNPSCGSILLMPLPPSKKYVVCQQNFYMMVGEERVYMCQGCRTHHTVGSTGISVMNHQQVFRATNGTSFFNNASDNLPDTMVPRSQLMAAESQNAALTKDKERLERHMETQRAGFRDLEERLSKANVDRDRLKIIKKELESKIAKANSEKAAEKKEGQQCLNIVARVEGELGRLKNVLQRGVEKKAAGRRVEDNNNQHSNSTLLGQGSTSSTTHGDASEQGVNGEDSEARRKALVEEYEIKIEAKNAEIERLEGRLKDQEERIQRERISAQEGMAAFKTRLDLAIDERMAEVERERRREAADQSQRDLVFENVIEVLKQEKERLKKEVEEKDARETRLIAERREMEEAYEKKMELLKRENEKAIEDMKKSLEEKDEAMREFLAELEQKDGLEKEMRKELKQQKEENEQFKATVENMRTTLSEQDEENNSLLQAVKNEMTKEMEQLRAALKAQKEENQQLRRSQRNSTHHTAHVQASTSNDAPSAQKRIKVEVEEQDSPASPASPKRIKVEPGVEETAAAKTVKVEVASED